MAMLLATILLGVCSGLFSSSQTTASPTCLSTNCVCTSDQSCWPSAEVFARLQSQVSQPLVYPVPAAHPCYPPSHPSGNCTDVQENWANDQWRSMFPGSMELPNFEEHMFTNGAFETCFLNTSITGVCGQGSVSVIGVDARLVSDIQAAVQFAVQHRLRLVVKNTGHDFVGRSNARGSFVVWTHNMKNITYDASFLPQGAPPNATFEDTLTLGAGVQWADAAAAANDHDRLIVSGGAPSVGSAGGWLQGGGHSPVSTTYGLGVDNVLEMTVVLSSGQYLVANEYQNEDLFWALRGGGGGTYGIVTSVTYKTYHMVSAHKWIYSAFTNDTSIGLDLSEAYLRYQPNFTGVGWGGYGGMISEGITFTFWGPGMSNETVTETTQAWQDYVNSVAPSGVVVTSTLTFYSSWYDALVEQLAGKDANQGHGLYSSRLLTSEVIEAEGRAIAQLLLNCGLLTVAGGKVSEIPPDSTGLTPVWREASVHSACFYSWNETTTPAEVESVITQVKTWNQAMYNLTPNLGAYLNEASPYEVNFQYTFFGSHYAALKLIKDKYDPVGLFVVHEGVGSDEWDPTLTCRLL